MTTENSKCPLCQRELADPICKHHRVPLSQGGSGEDFMLMHRVCHNKIHSLLNEKELARSYPNIEKILEHEDIQKFIKWVQKKPLDFFDGSMKAKK